MPRTQTTGDALSSPTLEDLCWELDLVDAETKLYLLATVRGGEKHATRLSGLQPTVARSALGYLRSIGVVDSSGQVDRSRVEALQGHRHIAGDLSLML